MTSETPEATSAPPTETAPAAEAAAPVEPAPAHPPQQTQSPDQRPSGRQRDHRGHDHRGGRRRRRGRRFEQNKFQRQESRERPAPSAPPQEDSTPHSFEVLPGESLAKYSHHDSGPAPVEAPAQDEPKDERKTEELHDTFQAESIAAAEVSPETSEPVGAEAESPALATAVFTPPVLVHERPAEAQVDNRVVRAILSPGLLLTKLPLQPFPPRMRKRNLASGIG